MHAPRKCNFCIFLSPNQPNDIFSISLTDEEEGREDQLTDAFYTHFSRIRLPLPLRGRPTVKPTMIDDGAMPRPLFGEECTLCMVYKDPATPYRQF